MSQLRLNPLTGRWVTIAAERASRPADFAPRRLPVETGPVRPCPFCPGNEEATPPALETYGHDRSWRVRVVPNLYPAFAGTGELTVTEVGPVFVQAPATGIHEVLVIAPRHDTSWSQLDDPQAGLVMAAIRDRLEDHARQPAVRYTQTIVNHGREAGASLSHPHAQLLGIPFVPGEILDELAGFATFGARPRAAVDGAAVGAGDPAPGDPPDGEGGTCLLCEVAAVESAAGYRVVLDEEDVLVVCPFWSGSPYEMLVIPRSHDAHLARTAPTSLVAVGRAVRDVLGRLEDLIGDVAYNVVVHTAPHHDLGLFHWHVHLLPRVTSWAGFEEGTGVAINIVAPEGAAAELRGRRA